MENLENSNKIQLLNYTIDTSISHLTITSEKCIVNTINPHSYCVSKKDHEFQKALKNSDVLLPDGFGIVLAARFLKGKKINKIAGYNLFMHLMNDLNEKKGTCFFLGSSEDTLKLIEEKIAKEFRNVTVKSYSPPYKPSFSADESKAMYASVNAIRPDVLFVGMTAPKQEKWVFENKDNLEANVICSIGAVFDYYAENIKRPSQFWIRLGLEWLSRLAMEPKRLAKRNLISTPKFILELISFKFFKKGIL